MEKKRTYQLFLAILLLGLTYGCTKSEVRTNKLVKQGRWMFTEHHIGTQEVTLLPKWEFSNSPEDKDYAQATWTHYDGTQCTFLWRFDYYEGTFSFMIDESVNQDPFAKAYIQCANLSGSYFVLTEKNNLFEFESETTHGYPGINVSIRIEPL